MAEPNDGKKKEEEIDAELASILWTSLTNMMSWVMFRAMLEAREESDAREMVDRILSEWRGKLMTDVNLKINDLANLRQSLPGNLFSGMLPDEEQTRVKFAKSIKSVEGLARQMLFSKPSEEGEEETS